MRLAGAEGDCPTAWHEPKCRVALSAAVGESVNIASQPFWSGGELVEFGVRPDGTDMDIGGVEASDRRQKPVLREVG
jgi:hypothetical protein